MGMKNAHKLELRYESINRGAWCKIQLMMTNEMLQNVVQLYCIDLILSPFECKLKYTL